MVLPLAAIGAGMIGFVAFGKDLFGEKLFKQLLIGLSLLSIGIIGYCAYKWYETYKKTKEKVDNVIDTVKSSYDWIFNVTPAEILPDIDKAAEKITPGNYEDTYKNSIPDVSLFEKIYWAPTHAILTGKGKAIDAYNAPSYYWKKLTGK